MKPTAVKLTAAAAGKAKALPVKMKATPTAGKTKAVAPPTKAARAVAKVTGSKKKPPVPALRKTLSKVRVTIRYDTRCYFNVRSKADISQLNLPHGTDN